MCRNSPGQLSRGVSLEKCGKRCVAAALCRPHRRPSGAAPQSPSLSSPSAAFSSYPFHTVPRSAALQECRYIDTRAPPPVGGGALYRSPGLSFPASSQALCPFAPGFSHLVPAGSGPISPPAPRCAPKSRRWRRLSYTHTPCRPRKTRSHRPFSRHPAPAWSW